MPKKNPKTTKKKQPKKTTAGTWSNLKPLPKLKNIYRPKGKLKKLRIVFSLAIIIGLYSILSPIYKDWDNAQFLKGIAVDFPALVEQIEQETGLELEITNGCFTTQEKFGEGKSSCSLDVGRIGYPGSNTAIKRIIDNSVTFNQSELFENNEGMDFRYRNKDGCRVSFNLSGKITHSFFLSCRFAIREANQQLLQEIFAEVGTPE